MAGTGALELTLLPGARELLARHERDLPQRDDLCGAFCGSLALGAAGLAERDGEPLDQDAVAVAAGSVIATTHGSLPYAETGRRDYRLSIPAIDDAGRLGNDRRRRPTGDRESPTGDRWRSRWPDRGAPPHSTGCSSCWRATSSR